MSFLLLQLILFLPKRVYVWCLSSFFFVFPSPSPSPCLSFSTPSVYLFYFFFSLLFACVLCILFSLSLQFVCARVYNNPPKFYQFPKPKSPLQHPEQSTPTSPTIYFNIPHNLLQSSFISSTPKTIHSNIPYNLLQHPPQSTSILLQFLFDP